MERGGGGRKQWDNRVEGEGDDGMVEVEGGGQGRTMAARVGRLNIFF